MQGREATEVQLESGFSLEPPHFPQKLCLSFIVKIPPKSSTWDCSEEMERWGKNSSGVGCCPLRRGEKKAPTPPLLLWTPAPIPNPRVCGISPTCETCSIAGVCWGGGRPSGSSFCLWREGVLEGSQTWLVQQADSPPQHPRNWGRKKQTSASPA